MTLGNATLADPRSPWLTRIPVRNEPAIVCIPFAGLGASAFSGWPVGIAGARVLPVQPPGRENRARETCSPSPRAFAQELAPVLQALRPRPLLFVAHCGAVPYALETARLLGAAGTGTTMRLLASSWGAPHRGTFGPLNHRPLAEIDGAAEVTAMMRGRGHDVDPELAEIYADILMDDLRAMRGYRFDSAEGLPLPTTVLGWTADETVPAELAHAGWDELGQVRLRLLDGPHEAFLECPGQLRGVIEAEVREMVGHAS